MSVESKINAQADSIRRAIRRGIVEYEGQTDTTDPDLLAMGERYWLTPMGEIIMSIGLGMRAGRNTVQMFYPERGGYGGMQRHEYLASLLSERMKADGGWTRVRAFHKVKDASPPNCPTCGSFMSVNFPSNDLPWAGCDVDGTVIGVDELMDQGIVVEIY